MADSVLSVSNSKSSFDKSGDDLVELINFISCLKLLKSKVHAVLICIYLEDGCSLPIA